MNWDKGDKVNRGRYEIIKVVGIGGFGVTYKAFDRKAVTPDTVVVIKTLNREQQSQDDFEEMQEDFIKEAFFLARCNHPHIVRVNEPFKEGNIRGMAMEYIEGKTLQDHISDKGRLVETEAVDIIQKIGSAVSYVHSQQLLHRDIKPANIMIRPNGEPVLIDFGIAREFIAGVPGSMTNYRTIEYCPPEQAQRQGDFTPTLDIYALAATLYHCVTGDRPLPATFRTRYPLTEPKELNPQLSDRVNHAIITGIALKPEDRSSTVPEWLNLFQLAPVRYPEPPGLSFERRAVTVGDDDVLGEIVNPTPPPPPVKKLARQKLSVQTANDILFGEILNSTPAPPPLKKLAHQKLSFQTAKIEFGGWLGDKLKIVKQQQQAEYIEENLGNGVKLKLVSIPSGSFLMGAPKGEEGSSSDEQPQHRVNVPGFHMGIFPVTQSQYQAFTGNNPSGFKGDNLPVERVSWDDAQIFLQQLNDKSGRKYRLPSEAEWEYACRAGTTTPFHFGETIDAQIANCDARTSKYGKGQLGVYREKTTPVGSFDVANDFGLYDMHGNVWEWCQDTWHENYQGAPTNGSAWVEKDNDSRLLRGGSWDYNPRYCRSAFRLRRSAVIRYNWFGFRIVLPQDS